MPNRPTGGKNQRPWLSARIIVPLVTFVSGVLITGYLGLSFYQADVKSRVSVLDSMAQDYFKQLDLTMLNSILRLQSMLDIYGSTPAKINSHSQIFKEVLRHTMFQRLSVFEIVDKEGSDGLPQLKRKFSIQSTGSELPPPDTADMVSPFLRKKVAVLRGSTRQSAFTVNHTERFGNTVHWLWRDSTNPKVYILFTAPIESALPKSQLASSLSAILSDPDTGLRLLVSWSKSGKIVITDEPQALAYEIGRAKGFMTNSNEPDFSSLNLAWIAHPDESIGSLTRMIWVTGLLISILFSLLLRFVTDQNQKVAELVVSRTVDLESALNEATEANLAKTRFLANMSHELRTPLNIILGLLDLVEEKVTDGKVLDFLKTMRVSGDHLFSLITDLLDVAQKDSQRELELKSVPIKCPMFFEEIVRLIAPDCKKKGLHLRFEIDHEIPLYFRGDPARVRQVLINLLRNAIKYTTRGYVALKVSKIQSDPKKAQQNLTLRISVSDTGVGIPKAKHQQIFDRFMQLESSKILSQGGVGLGLSIVKDLVEKLNGNISVESELGVGSTFTVDLDFDRMEAPTWAQSFAAVSHSKLKLLAVSENPRFAESLRIYLRELQIDIEEQSSAAFAARVAQNQVSDITHFLIDAGAKLEFTALPGAVTSRVVVLGNEIEVFKDPRFRKMKVLNNDPLLPTTLLNSLGVRVAEVKLKQAEAPRENVTPPPPRRQLKILIVDDDRGNRHLFEAYFADFGWSLEFAENGQIALEHYRKNRPDIVIADLRMPIMDGFEMTDYVRAFEAAEKLKNVPIILVTADALQETEEKAKKHGVTAFLTKPIRKAKIVDTVLSMTAQS